MSLYKQPIRIFDASVGRVIAKLPTWLETPLATLCVVVHPVSWLLLTGVGAGLAIYNDYTFGLVFSIVMAVVLLLVDVLKLIFRRPRPVSIYVDNMKLKSYSFPSAHAYAAAAGGGYALVYLLPYISSGVTTALFIVFTILAFVVATARVYLKAHFPSDVAGGLALGSLGLIAGMSVSGLLV